MAELFAEAFEMFATDHELHQHCMSCGGCILDPNSEVQSTAFVWCLSCVHRIDAGLPAGVRRPWEARYA